MAASASVGAVAVMAVAAVFASKLLRVVAAMKATIVTMMMVMPVGGMVRAAVYGVLVVSAVAVSVLICHGII